MNDNNSKLVRVMSEKIQELPKSSLNGSHVVAAEAVITPMSAEPSAPMLVGAVDADSSYVAVAVSEDQGLMTHAQSDFRVDATDSFQGRREAYDTADTVVRTNHVRRYYLDADEEAVALSGHSSRAEGRETNSTISTANRVRPQEVSEYDPEQHNRLGKTSLDNVDDSEFKTKYAIEKKPIGEEYQFGSDSYQPSEYKFGDES